jgi:SMC interacting uncharacterized protein involved in chromosome segregation
LVRVKLCLDDIQAKYMMVCKDVKTLQTKISSLQSQIDLKDLEIESKDEQLKEKDKIIEEKEKVIIKMRKMTMTDMPESKENEAEDEFDFTFDYLMNQASMK